MVKIEVIIKICNSYLSPLIRNLLLIPTPKVSSVIQVDCTVNVHGTSMECTEQYYFKQSVHLSQCFCVFVLSVV